MAASDFIKKNFVLLMGLLMPALLVLGFLLSTMIPQQLSDPPKYDLLFWVQNYDYNNQQPLGVNLVVKDGTLFVQYVRGANNVGGYWKKLYRYEATTQKVKELPIAIPADPENIVALREEPFAATSSLKIDTTLQSPDGYSLSYDGYSRSGLLNEVFWNRGYSNEVRLKKGPSSLALIDERTTQPFYYGNVQFIGWVIP